MVQVKLSVVRLPRGWIAPPKNDNAGPGGTGTEQRAAA